MNNTSIQTYSGKMVNPFYPDEKDIDIEDIAHALSFQCKFNGHADRFYSIAEHNINISLLLKSFNLSARTQLLGLLYNSSKAYISNLPASVEKHCGDYLNLKETLNNVIYRKYHPLHGNLTVNDFYYVDLVDKDMIEIVKKELLEKVDKKENFFFEDNQKVIKDKFLTLYNILLEEVADELKEATDEQTRNSEGDRGLFS